jgi:hypothetical protein
LRASAFEGGNVMGAGVRKLAIGELVLTEDERGAVACDREGGEQFGHRHSRCVGGRVGGGLVRPARHCTGFVAAGEGVRGNSWQGAAAAGRYQRSRKVAPAGLPAALGATAHIHLLTVGRLASSPVR